MHVDGRSEECLSDVASVFVVTWRHTRVWVARSEFLCVCLSVSVHVWLSRAAHARLFIE